MENMDYIKKIPEIPKRHPMDGTFELTVRCNLHCKMCLFRHDDCENKDIIQNELSAAQWIDLSKQAADAGTFSLLLTGGEPMLRPDFCEIYEGIYKQGFQLTLYTNATLVTDRIIKVLQKYPPHKIGITVYGASPDTYKAVCGHADAFEKMIEGVKLLQTLPSILDFRTTIIKDNYADADAIEKLISEQFGEHYQLTQTRIVTQSVRGACADVNTCRLEPEDNIRLAYRRGINIIKQHVGEKYDERKLALKYVDKEGSKDTNPKPTLFGCHAGMTSYIISWDGKLLACQMLDAFQIDVKEQSFLSAWEKFPRIVKLPPLHAECQSCSSREICNCCYASRYAETGDLGGKPTYVCKDTKIIQQLLKKEL